MTTPPITTASVAAKAGSYAGVKKYGDAANLPARLDKAAQGRPSGKFGRRGGSTSKIHKPSLDEMGIASWHEVKPTEGRSKPRKPTLDEMGPGAESKIYKPKSMREGGQEFGGIVRRDDNSPRPRSSGGTPGHRGGWKKR